MNAFIVKEIRPVPNFSYHRINFNLEIPDGQHMLASQFEITLDGSLEVLLDSGVVIV